MDLQDFSVELQRRSLIAKVYSATAVPLPHAFEVRAGRSADVLVAVPPDGTGFYVYASVLASGQMLIYVYRGAGYLSGQLVYDGDSPAAALSVLDAFGVLPAPRQFHRAASRACRKCGAVSTGGVYCPTGCGRI